MASLAPLAIIASSPAEARDASYQIDIPASTLPEALAVLSRQTGVSIGTDGALPHRATPALRGRMSVASALQRLLSGSGLVARKVGATAWRVERGRSPSLAEQGPRTPSKATAPTPVDAPENETIVVTAAKRSAALDTLPMAVSVVTLDESQQSSAQNGTSLVAQRSEGLAMTSLGPGRNRLFLRGVADSPFTGESQSTVAVVFDEARLTYAAPDPDIRLVDVERAEVLKGPQGSLYGTGALGGIYHIVPRRANLEETTLAVSLAGDTIAHGRLGWSGSAIANLPLARDTIGVRLVGYSERESGWIDTGDRDDSNSSRLLGARANLGIAAGGSWRIDLSGLVQLLESRDSRYVYEPGARVRPAQMPEPHDNDMRHVSARLAREGGGVDITLSSGMSWHEVGDTLDATIGAESFGLAQPSELEDSKYYKVWDSEARISGHAGGLRWLAGLSHVEARQSVLWTLNSFTDASMIIDDDRRNTSDTALFGDLTLPLGGKFTVDAGARLYHSKVVETRKLATEMVTRHQQRTGVTPSLAFSWRPGPGQIVYLRYGSAFRQGGSDIGADGSIETLKGDELQTLEAGWRRQIGRGGRIDIGIFASRWQNLQSDMLQPNGLIESANAGDARIKGAEATFDLPIADRLRIEGGANFTDARLTRNMLGARLDDRRLPVVPRYTARIGFQHDLAIRGVDVTLRANVRYVGPQRLSFDPAVDRPMGSYFENAIEVQARLGAAHLSKVAPHWCHAHTAGSVRHSPGTRFRGGPQDSRRKLRPTADFSASDGTLSAPG